MSCKSCWQLAIINKEHVLSCNIWIKKLTLCINFRYKFVIIYWCCLRYFLTIPCLWKGPIFFRIEIYLITCMTLPECFLLAWSIVLMRSCINQKWNWKWLAFCVFVDLILIFYHILDFSVILLFGMKLTLICRSASLMSSTWS